MEGRLKAYFKYTCVIIIKDENLALCQWRLLNPLKWELVSCCLSNDEDFCKVSQFGNPLLPKHPPPNCRGTELVILCINNGSCLQADNSLLEGSPEVWCLL